MPTEPVLSLSTLTKKEYKTTELTIHNLRARRGRSFTLYVPALKLAAGKILCVIGANGSGKTTLLQVLAGAIRPQKGTVTIRTAQAGERTVGSRTHNQLIGFVPDNDHWSGGYGSIHHQLRKAARDGRPTMTLAAGMQRADELRAALHLTHLERRVSTLSYGEHKKVQLVQTLMREPAVLLADDLQHGLDPPSAQAAENLMRAAAAKGASVLIATHNLAWAEQRADEILLLVSGNVAIHGPTKELLAKYGSLDNLLTQVT